MSRRPLVVIGAGPAGLRAAEVAAEAGVPVIVVDRTPTPARKLLMAGRGGLNLTNTLPFEEFVAGYGAAAEFLRPILADFPPDATREWAASLGIETFVGSSGRVFPVGMKAVPLLRAWLRRLGTRGVRFLPRRRWTGWDQGGALLLADEAGGVERIEVAATILALGGASWSRLGSDGTWTAILAARGVEIAPFRPSNVAFAVPWSEVIRDRFAGAPVKTIVAVLGERRIKGEFVVTETGVEGGVIHTLSAPLRDAIERDGRATLLLDLKPDLDREAVLARLRRGWGAQSLASRLRKAVRLDPAHAALLREEADPADLRDPVRLAARIKAAPLTLTGIGPLERAISSAGGVRLDEVDGNLELRRLPGVFLAGEMLDWEAPTGGRLLQACLATGTRTGRVAAERMSRT